MPQELPIAEADAEVIAAPARPTGRALPSLRKNTFYAVLAMGVFTLCKFGVVVLIAKFASVQVLGEFTYGMAISAPVVVFFGFQLRGAFIADAGGEFTFGTYQMLRLLGMIAAGIVLTGVIIWKGQSELHWAFIVILAGVCASKLIQGAAEVLWGVFQKRERMDMMLWSYALRGLTMILPFALVLPVYNHLLQRGMIGADRLGEGTAAAILLYTLGWFLVYWFFERRQVLNRPDCNPTWDWAALRKLTVQTLPLGLIILAINLCDNVPRWLIGEGTAVGKEALGFFGALSYITMAASLILVQALTAAGHRLATYSQTNLGAFLRLIGKLTAMAVIMGLALLAGMLICGKWFLRVCYTPAYVAYYREFLVLICAACFTLLANVFGTVTTFMRAFWVQVPIQIAILIITLVAAFVLIPTDVPDLPGLVRGGAWTAVARSTAQAGLYLVALSIGIVVRRRALLTAEKNSRSSVPLDGSPG